MLIKFNIANYKETCQLTGKSGYVEGIACELQMEPCEFNEVGLKGLISKAIDVAERRSERSELRYERKEEREERRERENYCTKQQ